MGLEESDESFALPQAKELVEGLTDAIATFRGQNWQASNAEIERIAKPIARMVARNTALRIFLARFCAPAVLVGAIGAYVMVRKLNVTPLPRRRSQDAPGAQPSAAAAPAADVSPSVAPSDSAAEAERARNAAVENQNHVLTMQRRALSLG